MRNGAGMRIPTVTVHVVLAALSGIALVAVSLAFTKRAGSLLCRTAHATSSDRSSVPCRADVPIGYHVHGVP